jgi:hypothetical protein
MFSMIRKRFTYANVAVTVALVFAMSGGAYAASKYVITSTKQISPKVLKSLKGAKGANGANGANGAAGLTGPAGPGGPVGPGGAKGETGASGGEGKAGVSVTSKEVTAPACTNKEGGSEFTAGSTKTFACNGKAGSPWTAGGLPKGASEMGEWSVTQSGEVTVTTTISFTVPLAAALPAANVHFIGEGEGEGEKSPAAAIISKECEGTYKAPKAASGNLCVFTNILINATLGSAVGGEGLHGFGGNGADRSGAQLEFLVTAKGLVLANGSWVVTG